VAKVYFYYSAMNAGKSTTLLQASYNYIERGMQTLLFAPKIDQRFENTVIYSRIGLKQTAVPFDEDFNFMSYVEHQLEHTPNIRCILIDEAHFLKKKQVEELFEIATDLKVAVLCYGLRSDFLGEPFEGSRYLLAWAEEITEIKTICTCSKKATMNMRIDKDGKVVTKGSQIQIGGNESYISKCMRCFRKEVFNVKQEIKMETAS
jgi:thymidine kinase